MFWTDPLACLRLSSVRCCIRSSSVWKLTFYQVYFPNKETDSRWRVVFQWFIGMNVPTLSSFLGPILTITTAQNTGETGNINVKIRQGSRNFGRLSPSSRNLSGLVKMAITNTNTKIRLRLITFLANLKVFMRNYDHICKNEQKFLTRLTLTPGHIFC